MTNYYLRWELLDVDTERDMRFVQVPPSNRASAEVIDLLTKAGGGRYPLGTVVVPKLQLSGASAIIELDEPNPLISGLQFFGLTRLTSPTFRLDRRIKEFDIFSHFNTSDWTPLAITESNSYLLLGLKDNNLYQIGVHESDRLPEKLPITLSDLLDSAYREIDGQWGEFLNEAQSQEYFANVWSERLSNVMHIFAEADLESSWIGNAIRCQLPKKDLSRVFAKFNAELREAKNGFFAIETAAKFERCDAIRLISEHGGKLNLSDKDSEITPFTIALDRGALRFCRELLQAGYKLTSTDKEYVIKSSLLPHEHTFLME